MYTLTYKDIPSDLKGWIDSKNYLPKAFDLVQLKIVRSGVDLENPIAGWWTGSGWDGRKYKEGDAVKCWRQKEAE